MRKVGRGGADAAASPNSRRSAASSSELPPAFPPRIFRKSSWIARLSSTTSTRAAGRGGSLAMCTLRRFQGKVEKKSCPAARTGTLRAQHTANFLGRECSAVQPEAVTGLLGGKAVSEDTIHVLGGDPAAVVGDHDPHARGASLDAYRDAPLLLAHALAGVLGIAQQVDQYLQHLVLVDGDLPHLGKLAHHLDGMTLEGAGVDAHALLDQAPDVDDLSHAAELCIPLLHGHDVFHAADVVLEGVQLLQCAGVVRAQMSG